MTELAKQAKEHRTALIRAEGELQAQKAQIQQVETLLEERAEEHSEALAKAEKAVGEALKAESAAQRDVRQMQAELEKQAKGVQQSTGREARVGKAAKSQCIKGIHRGYRRHS
jgi:chromosome segregation ATPase